MSLEVIKSILLPVIVAIVTGVGSSYLAINVTLAVLETRIKYIERDLANVGKLESDIAQMHMKLLNIEFDLIRINEKLDKSE